MRLWAAGLRAAQIFFFLSLAYVCASGESLQTFYLRARLVPYEPLAALLASVAVAVQNDRNNTS